MGTRYLYLARHGDADAFGELTDTGRRQSDLLGERLAHVPVDAVWHSPLPRAVATAHELARHLPGVPVAEAAELVDHVPYVPAPSEIPRPWLGFFDGYDDAEAARDASSPTPWSPGSRRARRAPTRTRSWSRTRSRSPGSCGTRWTRPRRGGSA